MSRYRWGALALFVKLESVQPSQIAPDLTVTQSLAALAVCCHVAGRLLSNISSLWVSFVQ